MHSVLIKLALAIVVVGAALPPMAAAASANDKLVAEATKGQLKALKGEYLDKDSNTTIGYEAEVIDLNGDGQAEVFTKRFGPMFGRTGTEMDLFIKAGNGQWTPQFGFGGDYKLLAHKKQGWPDIEILGPGTCFPVWRWNGLAYAIHKRCAS